MPIEPTSLWWNILGDVHVYTNWLLPDWFHHWSAIMFPSTKTSYIFIWMYLYPGKKSLTPKFAFLFFHVKCFNCLYWQQLFIKCDMNTHEWHGKWWWSSISVHIMHLFFFLPRSCQGLEWPSSRDSPWHILLKGLYILISVFFSFPLAFPHHAFCLQQFLKIWSACRPWVL